MTQTLIRHGDSVKIGNGRRVYQVVAVARDFGEPARYRLAASSDHPDAGKRVPDALRWYCAQELVRVRRRG